MTHHLLGLAGLLSLGGMAPSEDLVRKAEKTAAAARVVVASVRLTAEWNARLNVPVRGDELTDLYVRAAARAARRLPREQAVSAFLIGLGVALDDTTLLRDNPLTAGLWRSVESDDDRGRRLAFLGNPTMGGRRDLALHFSVSCAFTEVVGSSLAESLGVTKELRDANGGSGFSFIDLAANLAGIDLTERLRMKEIDLATLEKEFRVADFLPDLRGLREGFQKREFERLYGSTRDERYLKEVEGIRERIRKLR